MDWVIKALQYSLDHVHDPIAKEVAISCYVKLCAYKYQLDKGNAPLTIDDYNHIRRGDWAIATGNYARRHNCSLSEAADVVRSIR